jgi:hypothetical protein
MEEVKSVCPSAGGEKVLLAAVELQDSYQQHPVLSYIIMKCLSVEPC